MAKFGGYSQFGGASRFGGKETWSAIFTRIMADLDPPGVYDETPDTLRWDLRRVLARAVGDNGQVAVELLEREMWPDSAEVTLADWEELLKVAPGASDTVQQRQGIVAGLIRAFLSSSPDDIRSMLATVLNPVWAFVDPCDDDDVSWRFTQQVGNGAIAEDTTKLRLSAGAAAHCDWLPSEQTNPRVELPMVDRDDDVKLRAKFLTWGGANDTGGGIAFRRGAAQVFAFEFERTSGVNSIRGWHILDGTKTVWGSSAVTPAFPFWLELERISGVWYLRYGADPDDLTLLDTFTDPLPFEVTTACVWGFNRASAGYPAFTVDVEEVRMSYGKTHNNIELIEQDADSVPSDWPEAIFFAFVHRQPDDAGTYNLAEAQRILDKVKQAHTLIYVGESDCFLCDDNESLCDRDILGS